MIDENVKQRAIQILNNRRNQAEHDLEKRKSLIYAKLPRLREIEKELSSTGFSIAKAVMSQTGKVETLLDDLQRRNMVLQDERALLLSQAGLSKSDLQLHHSCEVCSDTGYTNAVMCDCLRSLIRVITYQDLCQDFPLEYMTFDRFNLSYYKGESHETMAQILTFCQQYADDFNPRFSHSIFMHGGTGLGKTHLSLSIINKVILKGYTAVYGSWQGFASKMEEQKFTAGMSMETTSDPLTSCDLLILDDVGSEFVTPFVISALHQIINTRINRDLPTIISSNLTISGFNGLYNERIASRILGEFSELCFVGTDVRKQKTNA